jgi:hypothetical protein
MNVKNIFDVAWHVYCDEKGFIVTDSNLAFARKFIKFVLTPAELKILRKSK